MRSRYHVARVTVSDESWAAFRQNALAQGTPVSRYKDVAVIGDHEIRLTFEDGSSAMMCTRGGRSCTTKMLGQRVDRSEAFVVPCSVPVRQQFVLVQARPLADAPQCS